MWPEIYLWTQKINFNAERIKKILANDGGKFRKTR